MTETKKLARLEMAMFKIQLKNRVIIHYSSFDPPALSILSRAADDIKNMLPQI